MNLQPIGDKVAILPDPPLEKHGTIFLPQDHEYRPRYGKVLAVGPGGWHYDDKSGGMVRVPMTVSPGQRVAYSQYGTDGIEVDQVEYLIIKEERILAVENAA